MLDLRRLRLLRELAHRGTLSAVAQALSYSPSTVSQQLAQLETEAGVPLLEPVGRGVRLTPQGRVLVAHAEQVLELVERAEAELAASTSQVAGTVRVAAFQSAALGVLPDALVLLADRHPRLVVRLTQREPEEALPALLAHDVDVVVAEEYPGRTRPRLPGLDEAPLLDDELRLVRPQGRRTRRGQGPLAALADQPWVLEPEGSASRAWAVELCRAAGFEPDVRYESSDLVVHLALVAKGLAAALLPALALRDHPAGVTARPLPDPPQRRRVSTVVRAGHAHHPAVRAVRDALRDATSP